MLLYCVINGVSFFAFAIVLFHRLHRFSQNKDKRLSERCAKTLCSLCLRINFAKNTKMSSTKKLKLEELGRIDVETFKQTEKIPLVVVLDNVRSMHNVGSVFRTADAFIVEKIVLCGITPVPPHREIHKAALGATESVDWIFEKEISLALQNLKSEGFQIIGIEQTTNSQNIENFEIDKNKKYALVLGNEVDGLTDEALPYYDTFLEIPQLGTKHSLNVSVCGGIVMWEFFKNLK